MSGYAYSPDAVNSTASAGAVGDGGALDIDGIQNGTYGSARVDLTTLLSQAGVDGFSDQIVDELSLQLGALGSTAAKSEGTVTSDYVVADGQLVISSPLVATLATDLDTALNGVGTTVNGALATDGALGEVANAIDIDANVLGVAHLTAGPGTVGIDGLDAALDDASTTLLATPLQDENELVSIDLSTGIITVDLQKLGGAEGLNGLDPNTELLDADTIALITGAVSEALGTVATEVETAVTDVLNNTSVTVSIPAELTALFGIVPAAEGTITVESTLGVLAGTMDGEPTVTVPLELLGVDLS